MEGTEFQSGCPSVISSLLCSIFLSQDGEKSATSRTNLVALSNVRHSRFGDALKVRVAMQVPSRRQQENGIAPISVTGG